MADIHHEIKVKAPRESVQTALTRPEALSAWQGGQVARSDQTWRFSFAGGPDFVWAIEAEEPGRVLWRCLQGPGDAPGTEAVFMLSPTGDGRTLVEFAHRGWPHAGGNFRKCNTHWGVLLHHLRQYAESGVAAPAFA
jgi:uncharacterized protein YndB with AHSA1/START domain